MDLNMRTRQLAVMLSGVCLLNYALAQGTEYPNTENFGSEFDKSEAWYKQCMAVKSVMPDRKDLPSEVTATSLLKCEAQGDYYDTLDMGNPSQSDWMKVVRCAHRNNETDVLSMLYANGFGVQRNLRLALRYACETSAAEAEMVGRVEHITSMMNARASGNLQRYDICDDITSGMMQGYCAGIEEKRAEKARIAQLKMVTSRWSAPQRNAFVKLKEAMEKFAEARGNNETDMSGTARAAMAITSEAAEKDLFLNDIKQLENGNPPSFTEQQFKSEDKRLNEVYQQLMHVRIDDDQSGLGGTTISKADVRSTQKIWLGYRDAFVAFGIVRYPDVKAESWKALLTKRRIEQLEELYGNTE